ncbi:MAG TPA: endonuclease domain-containing protein [Thermoanaerobaculia bacterium]|nr:endonuclease domain-containing protein [Thermoanaerobaculia bacterium]
MQRKPGSVPPILAAARRLRRVSTPAEEEMWRVLRSRQLHGLKFRRQAVIGSFVADFLCYRLKLVIELDGGIHQTEAQRDRDQNRTAYLEEHGFEVLRFENAEVLEQPAVVVERLRAWLRTR